MSSLTVGIINYNYGKFLGTAIESASSQGAEVIVTDDCSTDDSVAIAKSYGVEVIEHNGNSGSAIRGWNEVIDHAKGDYLILLSSDDALAPGAVGKILASEGDWIFGDIRVVDADGATLDTWTYAGWPDEPLTALAYGVRHLTTPVTMFAAFRTAWLRENGCRASAFDEVSVSSDTATCIRWLTKWPRITRIPEVLFEYRRHEGQETEILNRQRGQMQDALMNLYVELFGIKTLAVLSSI